MTINTPEPKVANITMRMVLTTIADVMGQRGLHLVLARAHQTQFFDTLPPADFEFISRCSTVASIYREVEALCGTRGVRGFMARAGNAYANYTLHIVPDIFETMRQNIAAVPEPAAQLRLAVDLLTAVADNFSEIRGNVEEADGAIYWNLPYTLDSWGRTAKAPMCWSVRASLHAYLSWLTGDPDIQVTETSCHACGDPHCSFRISRAT